MQPNPPSPVRVLIIEDHALVRAGYRYLLESAPDLALQVVAEAETAAAGYRRLLRGDVDLTVLDVSLPGAGGLEVLRRMQQRGLAPRVLVVSMHDEPAMADRAFALGAGGYLCKRSDPELLVEAAAAVLSGRRFIDPAVQRAPAEIHDPVASDLASLSAREFEVFRQLAEGRSVEAIARSLNLSNKTIANYGSAIRAKLGVENRAALARVALAAGVVKAP